MRKETLYMKGFPNEIQRLSQRKCKLSHSWSRHHKVWLLLGVVVVYLSVMMVLSPLDTIPKVQAKSTQRVSTSLTLSDGTRASFLLPTPTIVATTQKATPSLYTASSTNVGLMQPAVDGQGNAWVGEMNTHKH